MPSATSENTNQSLAGTVSSGKLSRIKCPECGKKVIPWAKFPESLHATVSCSVGVIEYVPKIEWSVDWTGSDLAAREGKPMVDDGIYPGMGEE